MYALLRLCPLRHFAPHEKGCPVPIGAEGCPAPIGAEGVSRGGRAQTSPFPTQVEEDLAGEAVSAAADVASTAESRLRLPPHLVLCIARELAACNRIAANGSCLKAGFCSTAAMCVRLIVLRRGLFSGVACKRQTACTSTYICFLR